MIEIPAALRQKLEAGATSLAWCWVLTRRDGAVHGFTDHDGPLAAAGVTCEPSSGFTPGEVSAESGFTPVRAAVFGALNSQRISEDDLDNGVWDGARVEVYRVDWSEPELFYRAFTGELGAVKRTQNGFEAEISGLSARLNRRIGRVYARRCGAELGDERCGVDVETPAFRADAAVLTAPSPGAVIAAGLEGFGSGWFANGVLIWTSGANAGATGRVIVHRKDAGGDVLELDPAPARLPETGDEAVLVAGCDKRAETCRDKFANILNFRGMPHMPGNDVLMRAAGAERVRDGGAR